MRGTLLNTATVAVGATIGFAARELIPGEYESLVLSGLGLVTLGIGMKLFFQSKNVLIVAAAISLGGILGLALGLHESLEGFAAWVKSQVGGEGTFTEALLTPSILFCVGPMTLLGCLQDALEKKIELLALKSTMDGFAALFFAAALGWGVILSAVVVLIFQGLLTLMARPLRPFAEDSGLLTESSATGGILMLSIGLNLLAIKSLPTASFLPAIFLAPVIVVIGRRISARKGRNQEDKERT